MGQKDAKGRGAQHQGGMSRRKFFNQVGITASTAVAMSAMPAVIGGASQERAASSVPVGGGLVPPTAVAVGGTRTVSVLSPSQADLLTVVLNRLIPPEGELPGAGDVGVAENIQTFLGEATDSRQPIIDLLHWLTVRGADATIPDATLDALLGRCEAEMSHAFELVVHLAYSAYYQHPRIRTLLSEKYPSPSGDDVLDESALDFVRQQGPIESLLRS